MFKKHILFFIIICSLVVKSQVNKQPNLRGNGLNFTPNKGQIVDMNHQLRPDILYTGNGGGAKVYLRKNTVSYVFTQTELIKENHNKRVQFTLPDSSSKSKKIQRIDMEFMGGNPNAITTSEDQTEGYTNYYLPQCPGGITNVRSYNKVTYHDLYKNTDVIFYGEKTKGLKYDIVVKPGGNPNDIRLKYSGQENLEIKNNRLYITTAFGEIEEYLPKVYQNINGKIIDVRAKYILNGTTLNFKLSTYNSLFPLIIDPFTTWITYYGGSGNDYGYGITTHAGGNVFIAGYTDSPNFPVLSGFQMTSTGGDAFIVKFDGAGNRFWATYYGGNGDDYGQGIITDTGGNVFITGYTDSPDFPVLSGLQMVNAGIGDAFVVKLSGTGTQLWATYYGGSNIDIGYSIATDAGGNIFVTGFTDSPDIPVLSGFQMTNAGGGADAFVLKLSGTGIQLWATYYGGTGYDYGLGIVTDAAGNIFITGYTASTNFPVLSGFQMTSAGGGGDAFVLKMSGAGSQLWATYYGGTGDDCGYGISANAGGDVFIIGYTASTDFPVLSGFQMAYAGGVYDAYVVKLSAAGVQLWATYYGGAFMEEGFGIAVDQNTGNSYITGDTYSANFPVTANACISSKQPEEDNYLVSFDPAGNRLCATYVGGGGHDEEYLGGNIAIYGCYVYITGITPGSYPVTLGAFQTIYGGGGIDAFIAQLPKDCSCSVSASTTPTITPTSTPSSCTVSNGTATVTVTGGTLPYTYSWSPSGQTGATATGLPAGTYTVTVTDASAPCTGGSNAQIKTVIVGSTGTGTAALSTSGNILCNGGNTNVTATVTGGTSPYSYVWSSGVSANTTALTNSQTLTANNYTVTITDNNGCTAIQSVTITQPTLLTATATATPASCGSSNGSATASISGGTPGYTYSWSNAQTGITATNLSATTYTVTVTDANACTKTATVNIGNTGGGTVALSTGSILCNGGTTNVTATVTGGTSPYSYVWSSGASSVSSSQSTVNNNLIANTYSITVTDNNGCTSTQSVTITQPTLLTATATATPATCGSSNGSATASTSGGTSGYTYSWSNAQTGITATGLSAATYTVTVTDANACTKTATVAIGNTGGGTVVLTAGSILCNGENTGSVTAAVAGGSSPYNYRWSTGASSTTSSTTSQISNLTSQIYSVTITDNNGCTSTSTTTLTEPSAITFTAVNTYTAACGTSTGSADVTAAGGSGALNYVWSNLATGKTISNVTAGTYVVTVSDANSCTTTTNVLVNNVPSATIDSVKTTNLTCKNGANGSAIAYASGGAGILTYSWSNLVSGSTVSGLSAATYIISVTDGSGCLTQSSVVITQPTGVSALSANANSATCGNNNGSADIQAMGGTGTNYTYSWSNSFTEISNLKSQISNLTSQIYYCTVTDQNNCSYVHTFVIGDKPSPKFSGSSPTVTAADCKGNSTGQIDLQINSGTGPYTYSWSMGVNSITNSTTQQLNNLPSGNYSITITDYNGCTVDTFITITEPAFTFTSSTTSNNGTCITGGTATVNVSGGNTGNYSYSWSNGTSSITSSQTSQISNLTSQIYSVTVTDNKGCTTISTTSITIPGGITASLNSKQDVSCNGNNDGSATVAVAGGSANYTYSWSNGTSSVSSSQSTVNNNLIANTYTVTISDNNGCSTEYSVTITQPTLLTAVATATNTTCGNNNGTASVVATGGSNSYTYLWSNAFTTSQISSLTSQIYSVIVTDSKGCTIISSTTINNTALPTAAATATAATITSGTSITLTGTGGVTYNWNPNTNLSCNPCQNPITAPTQTTTYTLIVTDVNNCKDTTMITIDVTELKDCDNDPYLPIAFSPNGDGQNDVLYLRGNNLDVISLSIYNRWGNKVFETATDKIGWDGTYNGQPTDSGVYVYYLKATCIKDKSTIDVKGNVTLVR